MASQPSVPTLPGGTGGSWPESWAIVHPKAFSTPQTPNPPAKQTPGTGSVYPRNRTTRNLATAREEWPPNSSLTRPRSSLAFHPTRQSEFIQGKTGEEEEEGVEAINILLGTAGPLSCPDLFTTLTAALGTRCAQIQPLGGFGEWECASHGMGEGV